MLRRHVLSGKMCQTRKPLLILGGTSEELEVDSTQKLHLKMVDILNPHAGDIGPGLVCKSIVIEKLVG